MFMKTKDRSRNQPPLTHPYPRRGICEPPASDEEGVGWWDFKNRGNELEDLLETKDLVRT
jgi:hypothetical protein